MGRWIMEHVLWKIPHEDGLAALRKVLDLQEDQTISPDSGIDLAACVLTNRYLRIALLSSNKYGGMILEQKWLHLMQ